MLKIDFIKSKSVSYVNFVAPTQFNMLVREDWFEDSFVRDIVQRVEGIELQAGIPISQQLGAEWKDKLSKAGKTLIMMYETPDVEYYISNINETKGKIIEEIGEQKKIVVAISQLEKFGKDIKALCANNNHSIQSYDDFMKEAFQHL